MFNVGDPELVFLVILGYLLGGVSTTVDAIRRPESHYRFGGKQAWVWSLILLNPIPLRFLGSGPWLVGVIAFPVVAIAYLVIVRRSPTNLHRR